ncbi:MAG: DNA polymerase III subunit gamma/tau [Clostridia bacterium]|nr:MAG: DNA polymerase III subunit gamma/tau [Clostridia bacterium]
MSDALYLRYRPQTFEDVVGQKHVSETLRHALRQDRIGHAYLFTGPRGTGKTSTARILAKAVNCLADDISERPDNTCAICTAINQGRLMDLIEIDAASNTSVDDVRSLIEKVAFSPSEARYKVYVIDEVHMLSTSAFNALLKTLEEPPAHVIFILATTEPHKIPATILSRCQRFDFHRITTRDISAHLGDIAQREGLEVTPDALAIIARSATGSMRDAISLLDQIAAYGHTQIDDELVREVLGMVSGLAIADFVDALAAGDPADVLTQLHDLIDKGVELSQLINQLIDQLRTLLLLNVGKDPSLVDLPDSLLVTAQQQAQKFTAPQLLHTIRSFTEAGQALKTPFAGYLPVELALLDALNIGETVAVAPPPMKAVSAKASPKPAAQRSSQTKPTSGRPAASPRKAASQPQRARTRSSEPPPPALSSFPLDSGTAALWRQLLKNIRRINPRLQALLRSGEPAGVRDGNLYLRFRHDFHREQVRAEIDQVNKALSEVAGRPMQAVILEEGQNIPSGAATDPAPASTPPASQPASPPATKRSPTQSSSLKDNPVVRRAVDKWGGEIVEE